MKVLAYVAPPIGERATDALTMLVKGMVMIFAVLAILMAVLLIMERFFVKKKDQKVEKNAETVVKASVIEPEPIAATDDGALVAVIAAAISVVLASEQGDAPASGFRVVSFKRVGGKNAWNAK